MTSLAQPLTSLPPSSRFTVVDWPGDPLIGPVRRIRADALGTFLEMGAAADAVRFRVLSQRLVLLTHPEHFRHVLVDKAKLYNKQTRGYSTMRKMLGNGLLTSEGSFWQQQRRLAQPAFHRQRLAALGDTMVRVAQDTSARWQDGATVDVAHEMMETTLRIVTLALMSKDSRGEADDVGRALADGLAHITRRTQIPWSMPEWVPTPNNRRFARAVATLDRIVDAIIAERRQSGPRDGDLLDMFLAARDEAGQGMSDPQLREEILTMMLAGHETTAMTLTWTLHLLAEHPAVRAHLLAEIDTVLAGRAVTMADLASLPYTERVIHEAMRLYPPAWMFARAAAQDDDIDGIAIKQGDWLFLSPWVTHRRKDFWPDPDRFDPDRFAPELVAARHRHAWIPFSAGQRKCIGDQFALAEARLVLVTLLQRWNVESLPGHVVTPEPLLTLRPRGGMPMRLMRR